MGALLEIQLFVVQVGANVGAKDGAFDDLQALPDFVRHTVGKLEGNAEG